MNIDNDSDTSQYICSLRTWKWHRQDENDESSSYEDTDYQAAKGDGGETIKNFPSQLNFTISNDELIALCICWW